MSGFCPHCDDFSIVAARAGKIEEFEQRAKSKEKATTQKRAHRLARQTIVATKD